jgi:hypothetical protein
MNLSLLPLFGGAILGVHVLTSPIWIAVLVAIERWRARELISS